MLSRRAAACPCIAKHVDDLRIGVPDLQAAEKRQRGREHAVALDRIEDLVVRHAVCLARHEVLDAVGRRRVDDAGAGVERHVVAEIDRRRRGRRTDAGSGSAHEVLARALARGDDAAQSDTFAGSVACARREQSAARVRSRPARSCARDARSAPGWPGSSTAWWSRSPPSTGLSAAPAGRRRAASLCAGRRATETRHRSRDPPCPGTRLRLRPAPSRNRSTS